MLEGPALCRLHIITPPLIVCACSARQTLSTHAPCAVCLLLSEMLEGPALRKLQLCTPPLIAWHTLSMHAPCAMCV
eukprot:1161277-Pelagomonas_calceolata.AAC.8